MIRTLIITLAFVTAGSLSALESTISLTEKVPPRRIQIGEQNMAQLTAKNCTIVLEQGADGVTGFAAMELQNFLSAIFGEKVLIASVPGKGHNIFVGFGPFAAKNGLTPAMLPRDGFFIRTIGSDIVIAGCDDAKKNMDKALRGGVWDQLYERATLFGVYDFLERFCGCRFYFPGELGTIVPKQKSIAIPQCNIYDRPDFLVRKYSLYWDGAYFEGNTEERERQLHPEKTLNYYRLRMETAYLPTNHGMTRFNLLERFGKTHPEYFAMTDTGARRTETTGLFAGHICWSSPVTEVIYQDIKAYLTGRPASERNIRYMGEDKWISNTFCKPFVDVMPQDGFFACRCPKCQARFSKELDLASEVVWGQTIQWANRLKAEKIPGYICMMAYFPYSVVPEEKVPDNVVVMVADTGPWNEGGEPVTRGSVGQGDDHRFGIAAWHKALGHKVWCWNYTYKIGANAMPGIPAPSPLAVGRYYKAVAPHLFGAYLASNCDRFLYYAMNYYVMSRIAWDNTTDYKALMNEHYKLMYGPAAEEMQKVMEEFESLWIRHVVGRVVDTPAGPVNSIPAENELWNNIYSPKKIEELAKGFDKAASSVKKDSLEAKRIELFRQEFLADLQKASQAYFARNRAVNLLNFPEGTELHLVPFKYDPKKSPELVRTVVTARRCGEMLEVVFDCEEPKMSKVVAFKRAPDYPFTYKDNELEFFLNPSGDRKNYFHWVVNSKGSITDYRWESIGSTAPRCDVKWNSGAVAAVTPTKDGFRVTLQIPLKNLPKFSDCGVPVNFCRSRILSDEPKAHIGYQWTPFGDGFHDLGNYGCMIAPEKELIRHGSFEGLSERKGKNGSAWYANNQVVWYPRFSQKDGSYCALDEAVYFTAPASMKIVSCNADGNMIAQSITAKLKPGKRYRLNAMVKLDKVVPLKKNGGFALQFIDDGNHFFPEHNLLQGSCDWTPMSYEFSTSLEVERARNVTLRGNLLYSSGTVWIDQVSLVEL